MEDGTMAAKLIAHTPQTVRLKTSGYISPPIPSGNIDLYENNVAADVSQFATATPKIPEPVLIEKTITENGEYNPHDDNADGYRA